MKLEKLRRLTREFKLVLVSGSPRRRKILREAGITFQVALPRIMEIHPPRIPHDQLAIDLACRKAKSIEAGKQYIHLGCDTIVSWNGQILDKPVDIDDARRILKTLSGQTHSVFTGLALLHGDSNKCYSGVEESIVTFHRLDDRIVDEYIASNEPLDKAGAYGIQGMGGFLVDSIEGNVDNVIGLPLMKLEHLAEQLLDEYGG